jgi:hypothetical protein
MSLDYPNRNDWLAVRNAQKAPRRVRYFHGALRTSTFNAGRNAEKRKAAKSAVWRIKGMNTQRVVMLADRRLRQRQQRQRQQSAS